MANLEYKLSQEWDTENPVLAAKVAGLETDTGRFKLGDGTRTWSELAYKELDFASVVSPPEIQNPFLIGPSLSIATPEIDPDSLSFIEHDIEIASVWYHQSISQNFTPDIINVDEDSRKWHFVKILIDNTNRENPFKAVNLRINGDDATIKWQGSVVEPDPVKRSISVYSYFFTKHLGTWLVLADIETLGKPSNTFKAPSLEQGEINQLSVEIGTIVFNTTAQKFQGWDGSLWQDFY